MDICKQESKSKIRLIHLPFLSMSFFLMYMLCYFLIPKNIYNNLNINTDKHEFYRLYTHSLLHLNTEHIATNMVTFFVFTITLECSDIIDILTARDVISYSYKVFSKVLLLKLRLLIIETLSILGGGFGIIIEYYIYKKHIIAIGVSGGCFGMCAVHVSNLIINWKSISKIRKTISFLLVSSMSITTIMVTIITIIDKKNTNTSYSGHIGGMITGFLSGIIFLEIYEQHTWKYIFRISCVILIIVYFTIGSILFV